MYQSGCFRGGCVRPNAAGRSAAARTAVLRGALSVLVGLAATSIAGAKIVTEAVPYRHGEVELEGFLAYDDSRTGRQPAVLVVHEWWGLNDFAKDKARALAELGYVAFAVDMYGRGKVTSDPNEAMKLASPFRTDTTLTRDRARAALDVVAAMERVDPQRIVAIGFCFGGTVVLQMAYAGYDLVGVVSFHGSLPVLPEADAKGVKARLLVLHGAADSTVPDERVAAFQAALRKTTIDWRLITYGGAKHAFMNPDADKLGFEGVGYDARTARRAWQDMRTFFGEVFEARP